ncbi:MAG: trypsin-like peptidase domain-containing protein [Spirochaetales bacterium]|nr:trypsin-like peptidase domain-containing protein [Spirochaetales bacterium]
MKRLFIIFLIVFVTSFIVYADLKDSVVIIKSQMHEQTKASFLKIADYFDNANLEEIGNIFRDFTLEWHGSGFIYKDDEGDLYILTNKHVVIQAEKVDVQFELEDGNLEIYRNCNIIYADNKLDLAVLALPKDLTVDIKPIELYTDSVEDGQEVWSAGFPGLLGRPSWQFAKGNVTNSSARIPEILDPKISTLIQHSASIDPGNSGGPLLIKDTATKSGYKLLGINTWLIGNRNNTFFSLPADRVPEIIQKTKDTLFKKNNQDALKEYLIKTCNILASELGSERPDSESVQDFISYGFVAKSGWDSFLEVLNFLDSDESKKWENNFFNYSPIETMRSAIFLMIWKTLSEFEELSSIKFDNINYADMEKIGNSDYIRTNFLINEQKIEISWIYEYGHWRIDYMNLNLKSSLSKRNNSISGASGNNKMDPFERKLFSLNILLGGGSASATGTLKDLTDISIESIFSPLFTGSVLLDIWFIDNLSLSFGIAYNTKGAVINFGIYNEDDTWNVNYLQFPVFINFKWPNTYDYLSFIPKFGAGIAYEQVLSVGGNIDYSEYSTESEALKTYYADLKNNNLSLLLKLGFNIFVSKIGFGVSSIYEHQLYGDWETNHFIDSRNTNFTKLSFGFDFQYLF